MVVVGDHIIGYLCQWNISQDWAFVHAFYILSVFHLVVHHKDEVQDGNGDRQSEDQRTKIDDVFLRTYRDAVAVRQIDNFYGIDFC